MSFIKDGKILYSMIGFDDVWSGLEEEDCDDFHTDELEVGAQGAGLGGGCRAALLWVCSDAFAGDQRPARDDFITLRHSNSSFSQNIPRSHVF